MIFKVSEKFKGSCVLPTINKAIWANMTISITGNDLRAGDIKDVVKKGILIPVDENYDRDAIEKDHDVIIVNNTDRVLVLGKTALRPNGSLPISKDEAKIPEIIAAAGDGLVTIISDEDEEEPYVRKKKTKKKAKKKVVKKAKKKAKKKVVKKAEIEEKPDYVVPETGEDKDPTAVTWNPQTQELEEAIKIPKSEDFIKVGEDEREDVGFVDEEKEVEEVVKKKSTKKKAKKKADVKKKAIEKVSVKKTKKKGNKTKSKKVKTLRPVGEKRLPKTDMDAAIELDSRGRPIGDKPGDTLRHLIDSINAPEDVGFVDDEQSLDRYKKRTDME